MNTTTAPVFLIGLPGAGKTHWGRLWAQEHGWNFVDTDAFIEFREQQSVAALFADRGEAVFRSLEQEALQEIVRCYPARTIVACGGGTPVFFDNLNLMKSAGCVVYLESTIQQCLRHLEQDTHVRPLLALQDPVSRLNGLLRERRFFYEQAHTILPADKLTAATFAQILSSCTNRH